MNQHRCWYLLTGELEALFEWLAQKELWRKSRYDFREVAEDLGIEGIETVLDRMKQLREYNERVAGNSVMFQYTGMQGEYWVDICSGARAAWKEYQQEKRLRMCPDCAEPDCREVIIQWCPHCKKAFGLPST
jgi:hypothetical protein